MSGKKLGQPTFVKMPTLLRHFRGKTKESGTCRSPCTWNHGLQDLLQARSPRTSPETQRKHNDGSYEHTRQRGGMSTVILPQCRIHVLISGSTVSQSQKCEANASYTHIRETTSEKCRLINSGRAVQLILTVLRIRTQPRLVQQNTTTWQLRKDQRSVPLLQHLRDSKLRLNIITSVHLQNNHVKEISTLQTALHISPQIAEICASLNHRIAHGRTSRDRTDEARHSLWHTSELFGLVCIGVPNKQESISFRRSLSLNTWDGHV
mmetsp:Transcript_18213/g.48926  ORF Transcript_18213/g.48926 Transcript_18213/m.48926 type:complete len:264 (-) Transcript_18213:173-964(-)